MCGRYALHLRPSEVRQYLENENMPVEEAPDDEGDGTPRQSFNFAPGYHGLVYRANVPDWGAGSRHHKEGVDETEKRSAPEPETTNPDGTEQEEHTNEAVHMKWGLIPFWTKRNPDYGSMMKTINCRDDSLIENRGMWNTMKQKKRCVVVAEGFYEWLKKGKEKIPHYIKRKDGQLMCMAGLWDVVQYEGSDDKLYTYTIITTSANKQLNFLHERMPVVLDNGSEDLRTWLDPKRSSWTKELQSLLKPYEGELEIYPVSKEVGKVGNDSPNFIVPVASTENKSNIANFFAKGGKNDAKASSKPSPKSSDAVALRKIQEEETKDTPIKQKHTDTDGRKTIDHNGSEDNAPLPVPKAEKKQGIKRELDDVDTEEPPQKSIRVSASPEKDSPPVASNRKTRSATSNNYGSPKKSSAQEKGSQKITNFFSK
ncbi:uncharacterized protein EAF01_010394 [Botrytis porri]|uniref:DUF159 domain protein n=1 Tax=Botrytis porri TaxID=87229 RepID=A0A4Z1KWK9_9HELO|nr:uncharacterized protein EAF01_010394 [Botrytis porri]KAF7892314.1 hypothetical protein EAF01_010394 [Botrytis porri]TGO88915.1 hypothetical protein BPOR_0134g00020 [Botrytis porri]